MRGVDRFGAVVRLLSRDAFRPCHHAVGVVQLEEKDSTFSDNARRDSKGLLQRETNLTEHEMIETKHGGEWVSGELASG